MIVGVIFISLKTRTQDAQGTLAATTFAGFIIALLLRAMNLVPEWFFYTNIIVMSGAAVWLYLHKD